MASERRAFLAAWRRCALATVLTAVRQWCAAFLNFTASQSPERRGRRGCVEDTDNTRQARASRGVRGL